jgi:hypothetical protein
VLGADVDIIFTPIDETDTSVHPRNIVAGIRKLGALRWSAWYDIAVSGDDHVRAAWAASAELALKRA